MAKYDPRKSAYSDKTAQSLMHAVSNYEYERSDPLRIIENPLNDEQLQAILRGHLSTEIGRSALGIDRNEAKQLLPSDPDFRLGSVGL